MGVHAVTQGPKGPTTASEAQPRSVAVVPEVADRRLRALAHGVEFTKRCVESSRLEELYLLLTNDIASVVEFDRSLLLMHLTPTTDFVAANNTPVLDRRARFYEEATRLGDALRDVSRGILVGATMDAEALKRHGLTDAQIEALKTYTEFSKASHTFLMPLSYEGRPIAHLVFEFFAGRMPDETRLMALLNMASLLGSVLAQKWLMARKPSLVTLFGKGPSLLRRMGRWLRTVLIILLVGAGLYGLLFLVTVPVQVGGEAEINPRLRHMAFCQLTGLVAQVMVKEGGTIQAGQTLALLDSRDLDFKIKSAQRQIELLSGEMDYLQRQAAQGQISKLAERQVVELKVQAAQADLAHLKWELQFLEIKAPVAGTIVTREVESLVGKKLQAGEPFCEVVGVGDLVADVLVPEDRVSLVKPGQALTLYLDTDPRTAIPLTVEEVAPKAEMIPRLGCVFRVRAGFKPPHAPVMPGMKGIGKVQIQSSTVWNVVQERAVRLWRRWSLYF